MHGIGSILLEKILNAEGSDYRVRHVTRGNGCSYEFVDYRDKDVLTVLGL